MEISYKVEGLRSIHSMPYIELKPVTLLVGLNNSGKSSFLRSLPLIKQSISMEHELAVSSPIRWNGPLVDFDRFSTAANRKETDKRVTFAFKISDFQMNKVLTDHYDRLFQRENLHLISALIPEIPIESFKLNGINYSATVKRHMNTDHDETTVFEKISIEISSLNLLFEVYFSDSGEKIDSIKVNEWDLSKILKFKDIQFISQSIFLSDIYLELDPAVLSKEPNGRLDKTNHRRVKAPEIYDLLTVFEEVNKLLFQGRSKSDFDILINSKSLSNSCSHENGNYQHSDVNYLKTAFDRLPKQEREQLKNYGKILLWWFVSHRIRLTLGQTVSELSYLAPSRSIERRQLRNFEHTSGLLNSSGTNLPSFLVSLGEEKRSKFSDWVKNLFGFGLETEKINGLVSINVCIGKERYNISDTGGGTAKILPALAHIWWAKNKPLKSFKFDGNAVDALQIVAMEQPELNLHPVQQARLAEAMIDMIENSGELKSSNLRFIVETHSEVLVSKLSDLIRENKVKHNDIQAVFFNMEDPNSAKSEVTICEFDDEGRLSNWPIGFFNHG